MYVITAPSTVLAYTGAAMQQSLLNTNQRAAANLERVDGHLSIQQAHLQTWVAVVLVADDHQEDVVYPKQRDQH